MTSSPTFSPSPFPHFQSSLFVSSSPTFPHTPTPHSIKHDTNPNPTTQIEVILSSIWGLPKDTPEEIERHVRLASVLEEGRERVMHLREEFLMGVGEDEEGEGDEYVEDSGREGDEEDE